MLKSIIDYVAPCLTSILVLNAFDSYILNLNIHFNRCAHDVIVLAILSSILSFFKHSKDVLLRRIIFLFKVNKKYIQMLIVFVRYFNEFFNDMCMILLLIYCVRWFLFKTRLDISLLSCFLRALIY